MTNVIYDFTVGWPVTPHIGFGIGAIDNERSASDQPTRTDNNPTVTGPGHDWYNRAGTPFTNPVIGGTFLKGSSWSFGYQAIAGIRYDINPLLAFDLDYRYLASTEPTFSNKGVLPFPPFGFPRTRPSTERVTARKPRGQLDY